MTDHRSNTEFTVSESAPTSQKVTKAVAEETNADPLELEPLFATVDPESLNELFEPTKSGSRRNQGTVSFEYADCEVTVRANGEVVASATQSPSQTEPTSTN